MTNIVLLMDVPLAKTGKIERACMHVAFAKICNARAVNEINLSKNALQNQAFLRAIAKGRNDR